MSPLGAYSVKYGSLPHPTSVSPFGKSCALPVFLATRPCVYARSRDARLVLVSIDSAIARDCGSTLGAAPLSKMVISVPPSWLRASCCHAKNVPSPITKSLFLPPSRQITCPVWRSIL